MHRDRRPQPNDGESDVERRSFARLAAQVEETRQPPLTGQAVDGGQKPLQPGKRLLAFQPDEVGGTLLPRGMPAARNLDFVLRDVLSPHQLEARLAINCSLTPGGQNSKYPVELRVANSSLETRPVTTTGSV